MNSVTTTYAAYYMITRNIFVILYHIDYLGVYYAYIDPCDTGTICIYFVRIQLFSEPILYASSLSTSMAATRANKEMSLNFVVCLNGAAFKKEVPKQFFTFKHWGTLITWCRF